jgi:hypothetical protein
VEFKGGFSVWQVDHAFQVIYKRAGHRGAAGTAGL